MANFGFTPSGFTPFQYQHGNQTFQGFNPTGYEFDPLSYQLSGLDTMSNLGNTIGNAFGAVNQMNSANRQAQYQPEAAVNLGQINSNAAIQQQKLISDATNNQTNAALQLGNNRINQYATMLPQIIAALTGMNRGGIAGDIDGFKTNFGQGASLSGAAIPQTPRATGNL